MKKTVVTSLNIGLLAFFLIGAPTFAQTATDLSASTTKDAPAKEVAPKPKVEPLAIRRQKIEKDLRATVIKLQAVIDRTQTLIDLLNKNGKDTDSAKDLLIKAQASLTDATTSLDVFAGVVIPETKDKPELKTAKLMTVTEEKPAPASLKDPLKKAEDALKDSKASLIASINALKEGLAPKDSSQ